ncbi:MAG TPA: type II toxin-antitoxin system prevent-host-death family antitoxin [Thermoanaerobaculia bacterium]
MSRSNRRVGVRELRQNLSVYLRRVRAGQTLEVTERGERVALLVPMPAAGSALSRLVSAGLASSPAGDLLDLPLPSRRRRSRRLGAALASTREERL